MVDQLPSSTGEFTGFMNHQQYHTLFMFGVLAIIPLPDRPIWLVGWLVGPTWAGYMVSRDNISRTYHCPNSMACLGGAGNGNQLGWSTWKIMGSFTMIWDYIYIYIYNVKYIPRVILWHPHNCWLSSQLLNFNPSHNLLGAPQEQLLPQFRTNLEITMEPAPLANDRSRLPRTQLSLSTRALPTGTAINSTNHSDNSASRRLHLRTQNSDRGCTRFLLSSRQAKWRLDAARKPKKLTSNKRARSPKWPCLER